MKSKWIDGREADSYFEAQQEQRDGYGQPEEPELHEFKVRVRWTVTRFVTIEAENAAAALRDASMSECGLAESMEYGTVSEPEFYVVPPPPKTTD